MSARFRRARRGAPGSVDALFGEVEHQLLTHLLGELLALLSDDDQAESQDPLAVAVGIGTSTRTPEDPVLARLFPDGYTDDDAASADFRRYTEQGLRERKRAAARTALDSLGDAPGRRRLSAAQAQAWLGALNDLRLALGTRLEVTEDWEQEVAALAADDPRAYLYAVYDLLSYLQETLVRSLS